eukprot:1266481-Prymnesium_polylepis.2
MVALPSSSARSEPVQRCCASASAASHSNRPQLVKLVCARTESATSSSAVRATAAKEDRTSIVSISWYGAARSRKPVAERTSGISTSAVPARKACTPVSAAGSRSHCAPSRRRMRSSTAEASSTLQLAGRSSSFPSTYSVTLTVRSMPSSAVACCSADAGFRTATSTFLCTTATPPSIIGVMQPLERSLRGAGRGRYGPRFKSSAGSGNSGNGHSQSTFGSTVPPTRRVVQAPCARERQTPHASCCQSVERIGIAPRKWNDRDVAEKRPDWCKESKEGTAAHALQELGVSRHDQRVGCSVRNAQD